MAYITKDYIDALKNSNLLNKDDAGKIADKTKAAKLNNGKGYSRQTIRNILYCGYTTTEDMVRLIMDYFIDKKVSLENTVAEQKKFAESLISERA